MSAELKCPRCSGSMELGVLVDHNYSGYAQPEDVSRARAAGFDGHLAKPPDLERLAELLASAPIED